MPTPRSATLAVRRQLRSLDRGLKARLDADAEALHRTRVATRRLRETLPLLDSAEGLRPLADLRRLVQHVTRALGAVREMDVALALVETVIRERPDLEPAFAAVRAALARERLVRLERMREQVHARRLQRASRSLADHVDGLADQTRPAGLLAERLSERVDDLRRAIADARLLYAPDRLHRVRLATKKLRYALELAQEMGVATTASLVAELRAAQECLGLLHDLETVARYAREALGHPHVPESAGRLAEPALSLLEERIHAQHAEYLEHRDSLSRVLDRALVVRARAEAMHTARVVSVPRPARDRR